MKRLILAGLVAGLMGCNDKISSPSIKYVYVDPEPVEEQVIIAWEDQYFTRIVIVGDSILDATFNRETQSDPIGWITSHDNAAALMNQEGRQTHNISRSGQQMQHAASDKYGVAGAVNYLADNPFYGRYLAVVIELAHNDWYGSNGSGDLIDFYDDYIRFLDDIDQLGGQVVPFCIVPILAGHDISGVVNSYNESYEDVRDTVRLVAATGKCELIETGDWYDYADLDDVSMFPDRLHLGPEGQRVYKENLVEALDSWGEENIPK